MGIWKWMKGTACSPLTRQRRFARRRLPILVLACVLAASPLAAKPTFGFRIMPGYNIPVGDTLLKPGFGIAGSFDFFPASFFGFFLDGEFVAIGLENVDSFWLKGGSLGTSFVWSPLERWSLRADLMAGIYSVDKAVKTESGTTENESLSGISAGARLSGTYQVTPVIGASVYAGYKYYSYLPEPFMKSVSVGGAVTINLTEAFAGDANVSVATETQDPVFPVFYSWYDDNRLAMVKVTNNETTTITDIETSFYAEQFMGQPKLCTTTRSLAPGESFEVPVKAFFNESMLELTEKIDAEAKIIVEYRKLGSKRRTEVPMTIPVYHRNAMNWDDDRRAAAFVSSKDPAALWFSKYVSSVVSERFRFGVNKNVQYALGIFESLKTYGLNYVIDPSSSYSDNAASGTSVDFLQYPYQTLMYRGGDCDDLSILYCSLFEAIGIDSAFITIPGHIYVAFSTGLTEEEARRTFYASDQLAYHGGVAWVPLEITLTKENFSKAWRTGAKEWNDANGRGQAKLYPTKDSWEVYKPVSVPGAASRFSLPDENATAVAFDESLNVYVEREIRPQIRAYEAMIAKSDTSELRNQFGVLYGRYGMTQLAKEQFTIAARKKNIDAWINLGNVAFQTQNYDGALKYYKYVLSLESENPIALLGAARSYYELEEFRYSDALYAELCVRDYALSRRYTYLASFFDNTGRAWSMSDRLATTTWSGKPLVAMSESAKKDEDSSDEPIDVKVFLSSLKATDSAEPDIDRLEVESSPVKIVRKQEELVIPAEKAIARKTDIDENPLPSRSTVPASVPSTVPAGGLTGMLSVVKEEKTEADEQEQIAALLKKLSDTPPDLTDTEMPVEVLVSYTVSAEETLPGTTVARAAIAVAPKASAETVMPPADTPGAPAPVHSAIVGTEPANEKKRTGIIITVLAALSSASTAVTVYIRRKRKPSGGKRKS